MEKIVDERSTIFYGREVVEYLVKWEGFGDDQNTWEPKKHILDKKLIEDWLAERPSNKKPKHSSNSEANKTEKQAKGKKSISNNKQKLGGPSPYAVIPDLIPRPKIIKIKATNPSTATSWNPSNIWSNTISAKEARSASTSSSALPTPLLPRIPQIVVTTIIESDGVEIQVIELSK